MANIQKITTNLWFDTAAEQAVKYYTGIFKNSSIGSITRYGKAGFEIHGMPEGTVMTISFKLEGQEFLALNGGPHFKFNEAISFIVNCETQEELDHYWDLLTVGGDPKSQVCGWLKDKFGLSWQIVPTILEKLMTGADAAKSERVMQAMLGMKKLDISALENA